MRLVPVELSADDVAEYYEGFSNATLWPLYHDVTGEPVFERRWWERYVEVNRRFATAVAAEAGPGATVWVQDYQLQLLPAMLREAARTCGSGSSTTSPSPATSCTPGCPGGARSSRGSSAPT